MRPATTMFEVQGRKFAEAISIKQPWAWLIVNGYKDIENRDWPTRKRGPVLVHAGKKWDDAFEGEMGLLYFEREFGIKVPPILPVGGIVGVTCIMDCVTHSESRWFQGEFGFVLQHSSPCLFAPWRGQLGFFSVSVAEAADAAIAQAKRTYGPGWQPAREDAESTECMKPADALNRAVTLLFPNLTRKPS